jgi:hypothetical protein
MPSLLDLKRLFEQDPNNPLIRRALEGAKEEFSPPPATDLPNTEFETDAGVNPYLDSDPAIDTSMPLGGMEPTPDIEPQSTAGDTEAAIENIPEQEEDPGYFQKLWRDSKGDLIKAAAATGLSFLGEGASDFAGGFAEGSLRDLQIRQNEKLKRRQRSWEDAYTDARSIPSSVLENPAMSELAEAHKALLKDMEDGKVDNEKNISNFLMLKSQYADDIEQAKMDKQLEQEQIYEDRKFVENIERQTQQMGRWMEIDNDPDPSKYSPEDIRMAQQKVSEGGRMVDTERGPMFMTPQQEMQYDDMITRRKQAEEDRQFNRSSTNRRISLAEKSLEQRGEEAVTRRGERQTASAARAVDQSIAQSLQRAYKDYMEGGGDPSQGFNEQKAQDMALAEQAQTIEAATGYQEIPPSVDDGGLTLNDEEGQWKIVLFGKPTSVDFDPTTTLGKVKALRMAHAALKARGSQDLGFTQTGAGYSPGE